MLYSQLWSLDCNLDLKYMDDMDLVAGLQRGDERAVEYVVQQYAPALYRFAYYQLQDAMLAEDLVSEVMVRMIGHIDGFTLEQRGQAQGPAPSFQAWLFRIARNLITDQYRARQRRPQVSLEAALEAEPGHEPGGNDPQLEASLDREQLVEGLATLTDEQRQVILLHVIEGWELPQVANLLDRSLPSIKGLYYRGIQSLHRALTADDTSRNRIHRRLTNDD